MEELAWRSRSNAIYGDIVCGWNSLLKLHDLSLLVTIILGAILRFAQLDLKPLWLDEIITALFALGRNMGDIPLDTLFDRTQLDSLFTLHPASCPQIARIVATESTHPPLFFCWMHQWLGWVNSLSHSLAWQLRSLSAFFGIVAIIAIYRLNRIAFSPAAGLAAAALMAVSPFCVYLSQESRHYTLPLLLITLALMGLVQMLQDWEKRRPVRPKVWISWILANSLGFYVHYFFILAFTAQICTLLSWWVLQFYQTAKTGKTGKKIEDLSNSPPPHPLLSPSPPLPIPPSLPIPLSLLIPPLLFLPWLPTLLGHLGRSETDWFKPFEPSWTDSFAPLYQTLMGWVLMVVALPVEKQPLSIAIPAALLMLGFALWLLQQVWGGVCQLWCCPETHQSTLILVSFTGWVLLEIFAVVYLLDKDITTAPRYHFIYYPSVCALLGASLAQMTHLGIENPVGAGLAHIWKNRQSAKSKTRHYENSTPQGFKSSQIQSSSWQNSSWQNSSRKVRGEKKRHRPLAAIFAIQNFPSYPLSIALLVGLLSSLLVINNWVFHKPYYPRQVAQQMAFDRTLPLVVVVGYENLQEVALGLGFALELKSQVGVRFAFLDRSAGYEAVWPTLANQQSLPQTAFNLWVVAPGLRQAEYPSILNLSPSKTCTRHRDRYYRLGVPYQLYRCSQP